MNVPLIWALLDGRPGNSTQALGLAERLGGTVVQKPMALTGLSRLSNRLMQDRLWGFDPASREALLSPPFPGVAIAAGRRLAPALRALKKVSPETVTIQIMAPGMAEEGLDILLLPTHDGRAEDGRCLTTLGAPNRATQAKIAEQAARWRLKLNLMSPVTALLIGGATTEGEMTVDDIETLWEAMTPLRQGSLLVTTSRRTPPMITAWLQEMVRPPHRLFRWGEGENPYLAFLGLADRIVVTADSVAMLSEASVTGKPVYAFYHGKAMKPKHLPFLAELEAAGHVKPLLAFDPAWTGGTPLDEAGRIAAILRQRFGWPDPSERRAEPAPLTTGKRPRPPAPAAGKPHLRLVKKK